MGDICPVPVIKVKKAIREFGGGNFLVLVDNKISLQNMLKFIENLGGEYSWLKIDSDDKYHYEIEVEILVATNSINNPDEGWILAICGDTMGQDEELGRELLKAYIFAITQLDSLPAAIVLYNRGVLLAAEDSAVLADLQTLERAGVRVEICGLCVAHFGLENRLNVGEISNMYAISEVFARAGKVVRP
jgi:selenium metabolism protein YedF